MKTSDEIVALLENERGNLIGRAYLMRRMFDGGRTYDRAARKRMSRAICTLAARGVILFAPEIAQRGNPKRSALLTLNDARGRKSVLVQSLRVKTEIAKRANALLKQIGA
jgi:hypothetical protein